VICEEVGMNDSDLCPCCSAKIFSECCRDLLAGTKFARTPLELMRSRYAAHACKNMTHILRTMRGKPLKRFDEEKTRDEWFEQCIWKRLEIIDAPDVAENSKDGIVEFKAYYDFRGSEHFLHERSKFELFDGKWYYVAGQNKSPNIEVSNKVGRNDACPCGSGKKYKKCCAT
jgi:SEC-C motif domain protein